MERQHLGKRSHICLWNLFSSNIAVLVFCVLNGTFGDIFIPTQLCTIYNVSHKICDFPKGCPQTLAAGLVYFNS